MPKSAAKASAPPKPALERLAAVAVGAVVLGVLDEQVDDDVVVQAKRAERVGETVLAGAALLCLVAAWGKDGAAARRSRRRGA